MFWNIIFLIIFSIGTIGWIISATRNIKFWSKIYNILMAAANLILTCHYVFMVMVDKLGL